MQENEFATEFVENFNMAVLDKEGRYCYVSPKWEQYTGICREEALGQQVLAVIPESKALECLHTGKLITAYPPSPLTSPALTRSIRSTGSLFMSSPTDSSTPGIWCGR